LQRKQLGFTKLGDDAAVNEVDSVQKLGIGRALYVAMTNANICNSRPYIPLRAIKGLYQCTKPELMKRVRSSQAITFSETPSG